MIGLFPLSDEKKLKNDISHILIYLPALMGIGFYIVGAAFPEKPEGMVLVGCPAAASHCSRIILPLVRLCR